MDEDQFQEGIALQLREALDARGWTVSDLAHALPTATTKEWNQILKGVHSLPDDDLEQVIDEGLLCPQRVTKLMKVCQMAYLHDLMEAFEDPASDDEGSFDDNPLSPGERS